SRSSGADNITPSAPFVSMFQARFPAPLCICQCTPPPFFGARGAKRRPECEKSPVKNAGTRIAFDKLDEQQESTGGLQMQTRTVGARVFNAALGMTIMAAVAAGQARAGDDNSFKSALSDTKYILDARVRSEDVEQAGIANDANATTLRARLGFETGKLWNTSLLVEGEAVVPLDTDYRPDPMVP